MHWLILLLAYVCGSIPTGFIVVWFTRRINIQTVGSGNIGSTNVGRVAGIKRRCSLRQSTCSRGCPPRHHNGKLTSTRFVGSCDC